MASLVNQRIGWFIGPAILANLSAPLLALGDTAIIGNFANSTDLAATAAGAQAVTLVAWLLGYFRMATTGACARASTTANSNAVVYHSLLIGLTVAIAIALSATYFSQFIGAVVNPGNPSSGLSQQYIQIRLYAMPATLGLLVITACTPSKRCSSQP